MGRQRRRFSREFRLEAVKLVKAGGVNVIQADRSGWVRKVPRARQIECTQRLGGMLRFHHRAAA